jgi:BirA family biotin operon repressor/biotin-[acetyl-CoA-carboxylase] ligase
VAVALACFDFFSAYAGEETFIKWPNDIYWRDRKAGGILIENIIGKNKWNESVWKFAVAGIGINVNQTLFNSELKNVVSLKQITGKSFDVVALAKELQVKVLERIESIFWADFDKVMAEYNSHLFKKDCTVKLKKGNIEFETVVRSVLPNGQLFTVDRIDNYFNFGEVEWLL